jgi:exonuclease III
MLNALYFYISSSDDLKDSFYEEFEQVFEHIPKCHTKILLGDFNAKLGREDIFKLKIGNESLRQDSNDNGVRVGYFATLKFWLLRT